MPVLTVWPKTDSRFTTASPLDNWPEPASSNQFSGPSMAYRATLREAPFTGTTADFEPVQKRLPLTSIVQYPPKTLLIASNNKSPTPVVSFSKYAVGCPLL